ncbi:MAG: sodium:solute symporter [Bacteroidales bacterium]|nr:sodium:solute symporter [Bacteroidales bacterium]
MATQPQIIGTWILILLYMGVILFYVIRGALKIRNITDYALGSIRFSPVAVGLSLAASMTSAATFVINPGFIANFGLSAFISYAVVFPAGAVISLIILTKSFRKYGQAVKALTLAQWIGKRYNSNGYALFMAFLSLLLISFIVLIIVALTKVLSKSLNVDEIWVLGGLIIFVFGYMMFGGANSMVYTNMIQAVIMLVVAFILMGSGLEHFREGVSGFIEKLATIDTQLIKTNYPSSPLFRDFYEIIFAQFIIGVAVVVQPHIITKSLLLKEERDVNRFLLVAVIVEIIFFLVVLTGFYARLSFPDLVANGEPLRNDGIIPAYVVAAFAGSNLAVIVGLVVVLGLISAGLSTLEGLIQSVSTTITSDIIQPLFNNHIKSERSYITINKVSIALLAVVAFYISIGQLTNPKLSVAILAQNGVYAYFSAAFIPVIFGIFFRHVNIKAPLFATITAIVVHFGVYYLLPYFVSEYNWSFGIFTKYLQGTVRNPAIAASCAIVVSTIVGLAIHWKKNIEQSYVNV